MSKQGKSIWSWPAILYCFMLCAFVGWVFEVLLFYYLNGFFENKGLLFGPYLPVYGFGGLLSVSLLLKLKEKKILIGKINIAPIIIFILSVLITTTLEFVTSYILEFLTGGNGFLWDYSDGYFGANFQGRIAIGSSLVFGLWSIFAIYVLYPFSKFIVAKLRSSNKGGIVLQITTWAMLVIIILDAIISIVMILLK